MVDGDDLWRSVDQEWRAVQTILQDGVDTGVRDTAGGQRPLAGGRQTFGSIALEQAFEAHARPIAVLRMWPRVQNPFDQLADRRTDAASPGDELRQRPLPVG